MQGIGSWGFESGVGRGVVGVMAIPKAVHEALLREYLAAAALPLGIDDLRALDHAFPPPLRKKPLAMS